MNTFFEVLYFRQFSWVQKLMQNNIICQSGDKKRKYRCGNFPSEKTELALPWIWPLHTISLEQTIYNLFNAADIRKFIKKIKTTTEDERLA